MRTHLLLLAGLVACTAPAEPPSLTATKRLVGGGPVGGPVLDGPTSVIALLRDGADLPAGARYVFTHRAFDFQQQQRLDAPPADELLDRVERYIAIGYPDADTAASAVDELAADPDIESAALDPIGAFSLAPTDPAYAGSPSPWLFGTTTRYQWALQPAPQAWPTLALQTAWAKTTGHAYLADLDNGITPHHPELDDQLSPTRTAYRPQLSRGFVLAEGSYLPDPSTDEAADEHYATHGTHTAGIMVAAANNSTGVAGICWGCSLIEARTETTLTSLSAAIQWAVDNGAQVLNMSLHQDPIRDCNTVTNDAVCDMLAFAARRDVVIVAAAGNGATTRIDFPSVDPRVIAVGGIQSNGARWCETPSCAPGDEQGSNIGAGLALVAPARDVVSTTYYGHDWSAPSRCGDTRAGDTLGVLPTGYGTCTGTSMATPHVTAIAGLVRSASPLLSANGVRALLTTTASSAAAYTTASGYGVPNAGAAVQGALGTLPNLRTPLFAYASAQAADHLYTTVPQQAEAAVHGTLQPRPRVRLAQSTWTMQCLPGGAQCGTPTNLLPVVLDPPPMVLNPDGSVSHQAGYIVQLATDHQDFFWPFTPLYYTSDASGGVPLDLVWPTRATGVTVTFTMTIIGETTLPYVPDTAAPLVGYQLPDTMLPHRETRSAISLFTANPVGAGLVPLTRMSFRCGDTAAACPNGYRVSHVYAADQAALNAFANAGYKVDGVEGYLYPSTVAQPAGTAPLCRLTSTSGDWVLFPGTLSGTTPQCVRAGYAVSPLAPAFVGWAPTGVDPIDEPPHAVISFVQCWSLACLLSARTSTDDVGVQTVSWSWGDGTSTTGPADSPAIALFHVYANPGTYAIALTVTDTGGHSSSTSTTVSPFVSPIPRFTQTCTAATHTCTFDDSASVDYTYSWWTFGDGGATDTYLPTVTHTFPHAGTYQVKLREMDAPGYEATVTVAVAVP